MSIEELEKYLRQQIKEMDSIINYHSHAGAVKTENEIVCFAHTKRDVYAEILIKIQPQGGE